MNWEVCCYAKMDWGSGFKRPHHMDEVFLVKMVWNIIKTHMIFGARCFSPKYGKHDDLMVSCNSQPYDSPLWKSLGEGLKRFTSSLIVANWFGAISILVGDRVG